MVGPAQDTYTHADTDSDDGQESLDAFKRITAKLVPVGSVGCWFDRPGGTDVETQTDVPTAQNQTVSVQTESTGDVVAAGNAGERRQQRRAADAR